MQVLGRMTRALESLVHLCRRESCAPNVGFLIRFLKVGGKNTLNAWPAPATTLPWFEQIAGCIECAHVKLLPPWFGSFTNTVVVQRLVKNLNRRKEGWIPVHSLQIVVGDCRFRNAKVAGII